MNSILYKVYEINDLINRNGDSSARVTAFPFEVFPEEIQNIILETNKCLQYPIDFIATSILFAASVAIGNSHKVELKKGWQESAVLYIVIVSPAGTNKSHPLTFALQPLILYDKATYQKFLLELKEFEKLQRLTKKNKEASDVPESSKPFWKKFLVTDFTPEALTDVHKHNLRGIGVYVDELAGWIKNFNRYNNGSEMEFWLSAWSGKPINIDRKSGNPIFINNPSISVCGTIQNDVLPEFAKGGKTQNGFIDRILFVIPEDIRKEYWSNLELPDWVSVKWNDVITKLITKPELSDEANNPIPNILRFTNEAHKLVFEWQRKNTDEMNSLINESSRGIFSKLEIYIIRLSLILEMINHACTGAQVVYVSEESVRGAIKLIEYFKNSALRAQTFISKVNPYYNLSENFQKLHQLLPEEFNTSDGIKAAEKLSIKQRTFNEFLKNKDLFKKISHGIYRKMF